MYTAINNLDYGFDFKKCAMDPYDKVRREELESQLENSKWFKKEKEEGEKAHYYYTALENKNTYKEKLSHLTYKKELEDIVSRTHETTHSSPI